MNRSVCIFASRETLSTLTQTIAAATLAASGSATTLDVLVNGNPQLAQDLRDSLMASAHRPVKPPVPIRIWTIELGDKANAWNQYIQNIWCDEDLVFFMDGYVRLNPDALTLLGNAVTTRANVLAGTGVPTVGREAQALKKTMLKDGGFHGNFCCIKRAALAQIKQRAITLPLGLYRVDALMGAFLSFGLNSEKNDWNPKQIWVEVAASWQTDPKHWWRWSDLRAQLKRVLRQSRGLLENQAVKNHLETRRQPMESLPKTMAELVLDWVQRCPAQARELCQKNPLARLELKKIRQASHNPSALSPLPAQLWPGTST